MEDKFKGRNMFFRRRLLNVHAFLIVGYSCHWMSEVLPVVRQKKNIEAKTRVSCLDKSSLGRIDIFGDNFHAGAVTYMHHGIGSGEAESAGNLFMYKVACSLTGYIFILPLFCPTALWSPQSKFL